MALEKTIKSAAGVPVSYHRIIQLDIYVNECARVMVRSYITPQDRESDGDPEANVYFEDVYITLEDTDGTGMSVSKAYKLLKENPMFEGAMDC